MDFTDRTIGHYQVLNRLGEGAMGVVYRALDTRLNRVVAIKFLAQHLWSSTSARDRMTAEARAASGLDHPNIATIYEIGEVADAALYIVMAFYAGNPLSYWIHSGALPAAQSLDIATQIARGLACAHKHGITHRDIKPDNIMLTQDGVVKILDFGLAKSESVDLTGPGSTLGTPAFMAPEQIRGEKVDHRCDLWALGVVLFNMITGKRPFSGGAIHVLAHQILNAVPELTAVPPLLRGMLAKALTKPRAQRFQSADEFIEALRKSGSLPLSPGMTVTQTLQLPISSFSQKAAPEFASETTAVSGLGIAGSGEFRQVTLMSCQLVEPGSIEAACGLEVFDEIHVAFEELCESVADRLGGGAASQSDTEMRLHFGYPVAHEDDTVRAVAAGLEIVERMAALGTVFRVRIPAVEKCDLTVRIGIHTGSVIARGTGVQSHRGGMFGSVGGLAARVQQTAPQGGVWITSDTLDVVRGFFDVREQDGMQVSHGPHTVKVFSVLGRTSAGNRMEAEGTLTELVSRQRELGTLIDCWSEAKDGHGQAVLLSGDPGIGKSRLVRALKDHLADQAVLVLEGRCSPHHLNTPLHPIQEILGQLFHFERGDSPETRIGKLRAYLSKLRFSLTEGVAALAPLLSLEPNAAVTNLQPQRQREKYLFTILKLLEAAAATSPLLWIVEDLHWADPTTLDLLGLAVARSEATQILAVMTARTGYLPAWANRSSLKPIDVGRLSRREAELMIRRLAGGKRLPNEVTASLVAKAEGVPLYVEELTRNVLTSGALRQTPDGWELAGALTSLAIPGTLKDSLMARLDRLGTAKEVAQVASVLGRTFSPEWLEAVCPLDTPLLNESLAELVEAEVLFRSGDPPTVEYTFKHALIMDAAYQSMLTRTRQDYHEKFARVLDRLFPEVAESHPELVAHHFTDGGQRPEAIRYWRKAGEDARRRSANIEAAAHFRKGLDLTPYLPESRERVQAELGLWTALASAQLAIEGYAAANVGNSFRHVQKLGLEAGLSRPQFDALQGLWAFQVVRGELNIALESTVRLTEIAVGLGDPALRLEAVLRRGITLGILGQLVEARDCLEEVAVGGGAIDHRDSAFLFGQDRQVACLCHLALVLCLGGNITVAEETAEKAVALARELAHPFSLSWAYLYSALVQTLRCDAARVREFADALKGLAEEEGFAYRLAQARVLDGWATVVEFEDDAGLNEIRAGMSSAFATGARVYGPYYYSLLADACMRLGQMEAALEAVNAGLNGNLGTAERIFESQLLRQKAELLRRSGDTPAEASRILTSAIETARTQGARYLELRALMISVEAQPGNPEILADLATVLRALDSEGLTHSVEQARSLLAGMRRNAATPG